jgi:hypothetical protein
MSSSHKLNIGHLATDFKDGETMPGIGAVVRKPKMRCENYKLTMFVEDAKRELKHPEGKSDL